SALGVSQMRKLDRFVAARNAVAERYRAAFAQLESLRMPPAAPDGATHAYHLFAVVHAGGAPAPRRLYDGLRERGTYAQVHYLPALLHPFYRHGYGGAPGQFPHAEAYYDGCLSLPCFPSLTVAEQDAVIAAVRELV